MQVQCPGCQKTLNAADHLAGKVVKCPGCGGQMQLPAEESAAGPVTAPEPEPASAPARVPPTSPSGRTAAPPGTRRCQFCGEQIQASAVKCRHCGETLSAPRRRAQMAGGQLVKSYQAGMGGLGIALFVIGGLFGLIFLLMGVAIIGFGGAEAVMAAAVFYSVVGGFVLAIWVFGYLAWKLHNWVNWVIAVVTAPLIALNVAGMIMTGLYRGAVPLMVMLALLVTAISNIRKHSKIVASGLDPRAVAKRPKAAARPGKPAARVRGRR